MFDVSFWQTLPNPMQRPAAIAIFGSLIAHGIFFAVFPILTTSNASDTDTQRVVGVVDLSPQERSRLPKSTLTSQVPLPPIQTQKGGSIKLPLGNFPPIGDPSSIYQIPNLYFPPDPADDPSPFNKRRETITIPVRPTPKPAPSSSANPAPSPAPNSSPGSPNSSPSSAPSPAPSPSPNPSPSPVKTALETQKELIKSLTYNPEGTTVAEQPGRYGTWFEENITKPGTINDDNLTTQILENTVPYPPDLPLLANYTPAIIPVLVDPTGKVMTPELTEAGMLGKTGYGVLDNMALKIVTDNIAKNKFPATNKYVIYQFKITFAAPK